jgi:hypothetical protein
LAQGLTGKALVLLDITRLSPNWSGLMEQLS